MSALSLAFLRKKKKNKDLQLLMAVLKRTHIILHTFWILLPLKTFVCFLCAKHTRDFISLKLKQVSFYCAFKPLLKWPLFWLADLVRWTHHVHICALCRSVHVITNGVSSIYTVQPDKFEPETHAEAKEEENKPRVQRPLEKILTLGLNQRRVRH